MFTLRQEEAFLDRERELGNRPMEDLHIFEEADAIPSNTFKWGAVIKAGMAQSYDGHDTVWWNISLENLKLLKYMHENYAQKVNLQTVKVAQTLLNPAPGLNLVVTYFKIITPRYQMNTEMDIRVWLTLNYEENEKKLAKKREKLIRRDIEFWEDFVAHHDAHSEEVDAGPIPFEEFYEINSYLRRRLQQLEK
jgi:hypothetical protein